MYYLNVICYIKQLNLVENIFRNKGSRSLNPVCYLCFNAFEDLYVLLLSQSSLSFRSYITLWPLVGLSMTAIFFFQLVKQI